MIRHEDDETVAMDVPENDDPGSYASEVANVWGWEMLIDLKGCQFIEKDKRNHMAHFLHVLVAAIDMQKVGPPKLDWCGVGPEREGWTIYQPITTSSIVGHFMPATGRGFLNVFSCNPFAPEVVEAVVKTFLQPEDVDWALVPRG